MPPANTPQPWRNIGAILALLFALYAGVAFGGTHNPSLGLDLRGGTEAILTAKAPNGHAVTSSALSKAVEIIRERVNGIGVSSAQVTTQGNDHIVVAVPGAGHDQVVNRVGQTAQLRFRQVLEVTAPGPLTLKPSATPTPTKSGAKTSTAKTTPTPSSSVRAPTPSATSSSHGRALSAALLASPSPTPTPSATATPTPTASATPAPAASGAALPANATPAQLFSMVDCTNKKQAGQLVNYDRANKQIVACAQDGSAKYLLDVAKVLGTQVSSASAVLGQQGWEVDLSFNGSGAKAWGDLTQKAFNAGSGSPQNQVAIVLDGVVVSAPRIIQPILGGQAQITGNFTQTQAQDLANTLKYGALPLRFELSSVSTVSPTLGSSQLHGGLIAGAIGLGLVVLYSFLYYRALGFVVVASLGLSGALLYAAVTLLGEAINYTLSLAGIAGFIVAVGITADSFVVFFERIRDEVREGRSASVRSAVERAWPRARRTILSADTVSLLAAAVLYLVSIGDVRGFAFTLGLSTLSDLVIVFLFTKPVMTLLVRTRFYRSDSSWSGLSVSRMGGRLATPPLRRGGARPAPATGEEA